MTTIRLHLDWPTPEVLCFDFPLSGEELRKLRASQSRYAQVSNNGHIVDIVDMFCDNNRVEDVDRYRIRLVQDRPTLIPHLSREISPETNRYNDISPQQPGGNTLVVLLESPSRHEYDGAPSCRIAPAQGQTGCGLLCHLGNLLGKAIQTLDDDDGYLRDNLQDGTRLIISNPIQFEASLLYAINVTSKRRRLTDTVWKKLWNVDLIRQSFLERLTGYTPSIIINSCTRTLKPLVRGHLTSNNNIHLPYIYGTHHPSSSTYGNHELYIQCLPNLI